MKDKISCIVVDDDEVDGLTTLSFLEAYPFMEVTGSFDSPETALAFAQKKTPDVLFLDIDMPGMNGFQLREQLFHIPVCVFITSYPDYALDAFESAALDFLVKPFLHDRFNKTIVRIKEYLTIREKSELLNHTLGADTIFIKDGHSHIKLQLHEIIYFEALNNYTSIVTTSRKYAVLSTMGNLLKEKAFSSFIRIHRSYAVQKHFIRKISSGEMLVDEIVLPVGRSYSEEIKKIKLL
jgi:two-component system, LytTR family, response regulator